MGNCHLHKIECFHTFGTPESERLKVTALNLFHPTASPPFQKVGFLILRHSLLAKGGIINDGSAPNLRVVADELGNELGFKAMATSDGLKLDLERDLKN